MRRSNGEYGVEFAKTIVGGLDFDELEQLYDRASHFAHRAEGAMQSLDQESIGFVRSLGCEKRLRTPRELANLIDGIRNGLYMVRLKRDKLLLSILRDIAHEKDLHQKGWFDAILRNL